MLFSSVFYVSIFPLSGSKIREPPSNATQMQVEVNKKPSCR